MKQPTTKRRITKRRIAKRRTSSAATGLVLMYASVLSGAISVPAAYADETPTAEVYLATNAPRTLVHSNVIKRSYLIADASDRPNRKDGFMEPPKFSDEQLQRIMELRDQHRIATASQLAEVAALSHKLSLLLSAESIDRKEIGSVQAKIDALRSELAKVNAKFAVDSAEILTPEQRQKMRHRLLLHQGRPGFGPGHGPGPMPGFHGFGPMPGPLGVGPMPGFHGFGPMPGPLGVGAIPGTPGACKIPGPHGSEGKGPGPIGDVLFTTAPMAVASCIPFEDALPGWPGEDSFTEVVPTPFTIPLGPPPMFTFGMVTGGPGHMVVPPPVAPHGGHAGPEGGAMQLGSPRLSPAPPPAPPSSLTSSSTSSSTSPSTSSSTSSSTSTSKSDEDSPARE